MQIYINKNGQQLGPFEETVVVNMLLNGQLSPNDLGIRKGAQQWQKLGGMFPNSKSMWSVPNSSVAPPIQPTPQKSGGSKGLVFGLIGFGALLLLAFIGVVGFIAFSKNKNLANSTNSNVANSNSANSNLKPSPSPSPTFDNNKYTELLGKKDELFKLSPPIKLQTNPIIKTKILVIEKIDAEKEASSEIISKYSGSKYGIESEQAANSLDELQTLILIKCSQGKEVGQYGPRMAYYSAYASVCNISIIDYQAKQTIGKKTFVNATRPKTIPDTGYHFINDSPTEEIEKYLKGLTKQ